MQTECVTHQDIRLWWGLWWELHEKVVYRLETMSDEAIRSALSSVRREWDMARVRQSLRWECWTDLPTSGVKNTRAGCILFESSFISVATLGSTSVGSSLGVRRCCCHHKVASPNGSRNDTYVDGVTRAGILSLRHSSTHFDIVRHTSTQFGTTTTQFDTTTTPYDTLRHTTTHFDTTTTRYDTTTTRYDTTTTHFDTLRHTST